MQKKILTSLGNLVLGFTPVLWSLIKLRFQAKKQEPKKLGNGLVMENLDLKLLRTLKKNGTTITLHLNDEGKEFSSRWKIENLITKYSDHIDFPIFLTFEGCGL